MSNLIDLIKPQLPSIARRAMTATAAVLTTHGVLAAGQSQQFVEIGTAMVLAAIPEVWSWVSNVMAKRKLVAAAKTGNPLAPPASKEETKVAMDVVKAATAPPPPPAPVVNLNVSPGGSVTPIPSTIATGNGSLP